MTSHDSFACMPPQVIKVRGHASRADVVCLVDQEGSLRFARAAGSRHELEFLPDTFSAWTDSPIHGDFALHPSEPLFYCSRDVEGRQDHDLYAIDLRTWESSLLGRGLGCIEYMAPYGSDSVVVVVSQHEAVRMLRIHRNGTQTCLFESDQQVASMVVSSSQPVAFVSTGRSVTQLWRIDLLGQASPQILTTPGGGRTGSLALHEKSGLLAHSCSVENADLLVLRSLHNGIPCLTAPVPGEIGFFVQDQGYLAWADEDTLIASIGHRGRAELRSYSCATHRWSEPLFDGCVESLAQTSAGVYGAASSLTQSSTLIHISGNRADPILPCLHREAPAESIWFESFDGEPLQGWLHRSPDPTARLLLLCHGGPTHAVLNRWSEDLDLAGFFHALGFHVFQPNFRGSTTFGRRFTHLNVGDVGGGDLLDVYHASRILASQLDLQHLPLIAGASYGGYLTLQAMTTQPEAWAAGIAAVPVVDWAHSYRLANHHYRKLDEHLFGGTPEQKPDLYRDRSPITHVEKLRNPTLIVAGENDPATPFEPIKNFSETASSLSKPVRMITFPGGHGPGDASEMEFILREIEHFIHSL